MVFYVENPFFSAQVFFKPDCYSESFHPSAAGSLERVVISLTRNGWEATTLGHIPSKVAAMYHFYGSECGIGNDFCSIKA